MKHALAGALLALCLGGCGDEGQPETPSAPKQAIQKAEQVQQQLDGLVEKQNEVIDADP